MLTHFKSLRRCEDLNGSRLELNTVAGKTAWPQSITYGTTIPGDSDLTFRTATGELVKRGKRMQIVGCDDWGSNLRIRGVPAPVCKPLLSVGKYTTMGAVTVLYGDKGYMFHKGSNVAKKIDVWVQKELRDSQYRSCTVAYKENNVCNIYMKPRENKIDAMPLSGDSESGLPAGSEPVRPENPEVSGGARDPEDPGRARDPEDPGRAHDPMRDDLDGDEAMVPRVPNLPLEPSARRIAVHELMGHAVCRSWCRHCVSSKGRAHAHSSREEGSYLKLASIMASLVVTKKMVADLVCQVSEQFNWLCGTTVVDRKGASDYASSFLSAFIKSLGFKRILVRPDNDRSFLSLIERVTSNLTGVELVMMTSPEGDHQANGFAEVGVREIKAPTRILRSQLEQRLGSRIDEKDLLMSWVPRHAANCVSRYRIMDDGRTPDQRRCGKTWIRPVVECGDCCAVSTWDITRDLVLQFSSRRMV